MKIANNDVLKRILNSLRHEEIRNLESVLSSIIQGNIGLLISAKELGDVRFLQGYISALVELLSLVSPKKEG